MLNNNDLFLETINKELIMSNKNPDSKPKKVLGLSIDEEACGAMLSQIAYEEAQRQLYLSGFLQGKRIDPNTRSCAEDYNPPKSQQQINDIALARQQAFKEA